MFLLCKRAKFCLSVLILGVLCPKPSINAKQTPLDQELLRAAQRGTADEIAQLLKQGADPNAANNGRSALCEAVGHLDSRVLQVLLDAGAKPDDSSMWQAGWLNKTERVKVLLDADGNPDACLAGAALGSHKELVRVLLEKGANVNASYRDTSPLHGAATQGGVEVVQILLAAGANPNATDSRGRSPLHNAMYNKNHLPIVKALVKAGAKLNVTNEEGITPVRQAAENGQKEIYDWLLSINGGNEPRATADPHSPAREMSTSSLLQEFVQDNYKNRLRAQRELVSRGSEIMPEVLKNIEADVPIEKFLHLFVAMGPEADSALAKLISLLGDKKRVLAVVFTLERMKPEGLLELSLVDRKRAAAALYEATLDPEASERIWCSRSLAMLGDVAEPYVHKMLESGDPIQQKASIDSLKYARFAQAKFQAELVKVARQGRSDVRAYAVRALGQFAEPNDEVNGLLLEILKSPRPPIPESPNVVATEYHAWRELTDAARVAKANLGIK